MTVQGFNQLHPKIQKKLYEMRWTELRPIQVKSINSILSENNHVVIAAKTASGKTEAAFLPVLSDIVEDYKPGVRALYVGPLRALINDQFLRIGELCELTNIPVHKWHGEVPASAKKNLLNSPSGVLLITPESLEGLIKNHPETLKTILGGLKYIIIDEMHSFIGTERGAHLKSLLSRIAGRYSNQLRLIGLSATIGDLNLACEWLLNAIYPEEKAVLISDPHEKRKVNFKIHASLINDEKRSKNQLSDTVLARQIHKHFHENTALVFFNSKRMIEKIADQIVQIVEHERLPNIFNVHHASISPAQRDIIERALRKGKPTVVLCSSTLEMGVDLGFVKMVGHVGPPWSVSSLTQRLGRSGRREQEPSIMRIYVQEQIPKPNAQLCASLFTDLVRTVALAELMFLKWFEPPEVEKIHASTFIHQVLSLICEFRGVTEETIFDTLITRGPFNNIDEITFKQIIDGLFEFELMENLSSGLYVLGAQGEKIVARKDFYAAFSSERELKVIHDKKEIGEITPVPGLAVDTRLLLGGRRWRVIAINEGRTRVFVAPCGDESKPLFPISDKPDLHAIVRKKMKELLQSKEVPDYLDREASTMLDNARREAEELNIFEHNFHEQDGITTWFTWTGTKINRTLMGLGRFLGNLDVEDHGEALVFYGVSREKVSEVYAGFLADAPSASELASYFPGRDYEKYDRYLPSSVKAHIFANNLLDIKGAQKLIHEMIEDKG
jgi:ATP-dependent helicase Lhr and Lhr-like helicase